MNPGYGQNGYGEGRAGNSPIEMLPVGYYQGLLTSQYKMSPRLNRFLFYMLKKFDDVSMALVSMDGLMDIDNASGAVLDMLGSVVGAARKVGFTPSNGVSPVLDDNTYRMYIKARAYANRWDGTIDGLQSAWRVIFPDMSIIIHDNQNMTANIFVQGSVTSIMQDLIENGYIVPRPEGVLYNYTFSSLPVFGFGLELPFIAGFDQGKWS